MTNSVNYSWAVKSVDPIENTFVVAYSASNMDQPFLLNLRLPETVEEIASLVEQYAPRYSLLPPIEPTPSLLNPADVEPLTGEATLVNITDEERYADAKENFKKTLAQALLELGVTATNVYTESKP